MSLILPRLKERDSLYALETRKTCPIAGGIHFQLNEQGHATFQEWRTTGLIKRLGFGGKCVKIR